MSPLAPPAGLTTTDQVRRLVVAFAGCFCLVGTLLGLGVIGTPVEKSSGGVLAADATLIAPAGPAFSIWTVIYIGLAAYVVWQFLPGNAVSVRARSSGWLAAGSMILNATWLLVTQQGWIWLSVAVILTLVLVLLALVRALPPAPAGRVERVVVDGTFGLYLGWVAVATFANIAAAVRSSTADPDVVDSDLLAAGVVVVALGTCIALVLTSGVAWAVAAASAWGFAWVTVGRLAGEPRSDLVGVTAIVAAAGVVLAAVWSRRRSTAAVTPGHG